MKLFATLAARMWPAPAWQRPEPVPASWPKPAVPNYVAIFVSGLPRRMAYTGPEQRLEILARRRQNTAWCAAKGYPTPCLRSFLLADCSPFTEWALREYIRAEHQQRWSKE